MKSKRKWTIHKVLHFWQHQAGRYALSTITENRGAVSRDDDEIAEVTVSLMDMWRARLQVFRTLGWAAISTAAAAEFMFTCPPFGVTTNYTTLRPCQKYGICPFCWARRHSATLFRKLSKYLEEGDNSRQTQLCEVVITTAYDMAAYDLAGLFEWINKNKASYLNEAFPEAIGAFVLCTLEPEDDTWLLRQRILAIVDRDFDRFPAAEVRRLSGLHEVRTVRVNVDLRAKSLVSTVGRITLYPRRLLTGPAEQVLEFLRGKRPRHEPTGKSGKKKWHPACRMSMYYGVLRQRLARTTMPPALERRSNEEDTNESDVDDFDA